jgi:hypothetical protein
MSYVIFQVCYNNLIKENGTALLSIFLPDDNLDGAQIPRFP